MSFLATQVLGFPHAFSILINHSICLLANMFRWHYPHPYLWFRQMLLNFYSQPFNTFPIHFLTATRRISMKHTFLFSQNLKQFFLSVRTKCNIILLWSIKPFRTDLPHHPHPVLLSSSRNWSLAALPLFQTSLFLNQGLVSLLFSLLGRRFSPLIAWVIPSPHTSSKKFSLIP